MDNSYILLIALFSNFTAQILKPILYYMAYKKWDWKLITASGGLPSSHSSMVTSLTLSVGFVEGFSSTLFSITLVFSLIIMYDAANVRYYAGRNIQLTRKLIDDLKKSDFYIKKLTDPIYDEKIKEILGHKAFEVVSGVALGVLISSLAYLVFK